MSQTTCLPEESDFEANLISENDLIRFLDELQEQAHPLYALLAGAPKSVFWIVLDDDDAFPDGKTFSVHEFRSHGGKFDAGETFRLYFNAYFFRDEWDECVPGWNLMDNPFNGEDKFEITDKGELTVATLESEWRHMLAFLCREAILANKPFRFDEETIRQYRFTPEDIAVLQEPVNISNPKIIAELRAQYDKLAAIDCLHHAQQ